MSLIFAVKPSRRDNCMRIKSELTRQSLVLRAAEGRENGVGELVNIAGELGWFPLKKVVVWGKRTDLAGFVHELRGLRNYVHPGVWSREQQPLKFTKGVFNVVFEVFEVANDWLLHHVHKSVLKKMERSENAAPALSLNGAFRRGLR
jgi:hypothetical protein